MESFISIGARLQEERKRLRMNQEEFSSLAAKDGAKGITRQSQSLYEKGDRMPDAAYLAAIATAGADVLYILTGERSNGISALKPDEEALVDNYRNSSLEAQKIIRAASSAGAKQEVKGKAA